MTATPPEVKRSRRLRFTPKPAPPTVELPTKKLGLGLVLPLFDRRPHSGIPVFSFA